MSWQRPTSEEQYCKTCKKRHYLSFHGNGKNCPFCKAPLSEVIPTFSVEYLNHTRGEHPEKGIRSAMGLKA